MPKELVTRVIKKELDKEKYSEIIFLCIGTNNIVGDSVGPKTGNILKKRLKAPNATVLGTTSNEINYLTINKFLEEKINCSTKPFLITVDSALSKPEFIGKIIINKKYLHLGESLQKGKFIFGNLNIKAIIGENFNNIERNKKVLTEVSMNFINKMALNVACQILNAF